MPDAQLGDKDLDDEYVTDAWLVDQYVGNVLFSCGYNGRGQLGLGDTTGRSRITQVGSLINWKQICCGYSSTVAIKTDGTLWGWGYNRNGEIGNSNTVSYSSPVLAGGGSTWKQVSLGGGFVKAIKTDGTLWEWGYDTGTSSPILVGSDNNWRQVSCGQNAKMAIKTDGTLWGWGYNNVGALGLGDTTDRGSPVKVGTNTTWKQVVCGYGTTPGDPDYTMAITTDGKLYAWGYNAQGQLGLGNISNYSSPVQVGTLTNWKRLSDEVGHTSFAIKTDGTLWGWGLNSSGQLGIGNTVNYSSPVQVGTLTNWKQVSNKGGLTTAVKTDGTLWAWGAGNTGQLGQGNTADYSSPVQVGSSTYWKQASSDRISLGAVTYREI
jgi:alpha-tubulin suppressor-like RCC1 family protein